LRQAGSARSDRRGKLLVAAFSSSWIRDARRRLRELPKTAGFRQIRRIAVFVVGMTVLLFGFALVVLPGPAVVVIPAGLAILSLEFRWARRWLREAKALARQAGEDLRDGRPPAQWWQRLRGRLARRRRLGRLCRRKPPEKPPAPESPS